MVAKVRIVSDLRKLEELATVRFTEAYPLKEAKTQTATAPA
jgi:hypothetical protein